MLDNRLKEKIKIADAKIKHYWLYVLKLKEDKYYIGITAMFNPQQRIDQHYAGYYGSQWTKIYKPVETLEIKDLGNITGLEAKNFENEKTYEYINLYKLKNVRGGKLTYPGKYVKIGPFYGQGEDAVYLAGFLFIVFVLGYFFVKGF